MLNKMLGWFEENSFVSWFFVVFIASVIFYLSSQSVFSGVGGSNLRAIMYHLFAFFFLTIFLFMASVRGKKENLGLFGLVILISLMYGVLDELHQSFVPGRSSSMGDIFFDSVGVFLAGLIYMIRVVWENGNFRLSS